MSSASSPVVYWCHQCNAETRPAAIDEDVLCTFCNQGFIEELHSTEVEPGVAFSSLPLPFSSLLRRPSPSSVGISRDISFTNSPSPPQPQLQTPSGRNQADTQGHRPRILSGQLSGVPSLFEAMMQVLEEMNGPLPSASRSASGNVGEHASRGASGGVSDSFSGRDDAQRQPHDQIGEEGIQGDGSSRRDEARPQLHGQNGEEGLHALFSPPTLILHGDTPNGLRSLELFIDHGHGMGPQMIPNYMRDYFLGPDLDRLIHLLAENDPNRYGTPPAAKSEVEKLPKLRITEEHLGCELLSQCAVCKDDFELQAEVQQMPCKHIYHPECILPWLMEHNSCPICRFELLTDDEDYEARKGQSSPGNGNVERPTRQGSGVRRGADVLESRVSLSSGEELSENEDASSRQFTLWGMPAIGFDMARVATLGLNQFTQMEDPSNHLRQQQSGQEQGALRDDGGRDVTPVQWLFRLFSSGSSSARDNASNGNQSLQRGSGNDASNS